MMFTVDLYGNRGLDSRSSEVTATPSFYTLIAALMYSSTHSFRGPAEIGTACQLTQPVIRRSTPSSQR